MRILLVGDDAVDFYVFCDRKDHNPEGSYPIIIPRRHEIRAGMAGNVRDNLIALGHDVTTILGNQSEKVRMVDQATNQVLIRVDNDAVCEPIILNADEVQRFDAVVICDYGKGSVSEQTIHSASKAKRVYVDTKMKYLAQFPFATFKINTREYLNIVTVPDDLVVTAGKQGSWCRDIHVVTSTLNYVDAVGAGDVYLAALVHGEHLFGDRFTAMSFASSCATLSVETFGTHVLTDREIQSVLGITH